MKVGIIDSGVQYSGSIPFCQFVLNGRNIEKDKLIDSKGHGTTMFSIISNALDETDMVVSLRIKESGYIDNFALAKGIEFFINQNVQLINISLGVNTSEGAEELNDMCRKAYNQGIVIVTSASNYDEISYPWACQGVLRVRQGIDNNNLIRMEKDLFGIYNLFVNKRRYGVKQKISFGNSAATAYVSMLMCKKFKEYFGNVDEITQKEWISYIVGQAHRERIDALFAKVQLIKGDVEFINNENFIDWKRCMVVPFCKEMDSLIKYSPNLKIVAGSGGITTKFSREYNIVPIKLENKFIERYNISTIIIGYLDKLEKTEMNYTEDFLVEFALKNNLNIFSFRRLSKTNEAKIAMKKNIQYRHTIVVNNEKLNILRKAVPYNLLPHKPVVGVFGTSSKQGKLTCQLNLKKELENQGIIVNYIGTEHQSALLGSVFEYPMGYGGTSSIQLNIEEGIEYLQRAIFYVDKMVEGDLILLGGQSWLIPYDVEQQTAIYNLAFLEGTRPDYAVLVINPELDNEQYVLDTKATLESLYKCDVIAIFYSDMKPYSNKAIQVKIKRSENDIRKMNKEISRKYNVFAGCINSSKDIEQAVDILCKKLGGSNCF